MKVYMDNCCYCRPFDNQSQQRIHLESEAVLVVATRAQQKEDTVIGSDILVLEIEAIIDEKKKHKVKELYEVAEIHVPYTDEMRNRAQDIMNKSAM
jgi:hypothetical protein